MVTRSGYRALQRNVRQGVGPAYPPCCADSTTGSGGTDLSGLVGFATPSKDARSYRTPTRARQTERRFLVPGAGSHATQAHPARCKDPAATPKNARGPKAKRLDLEPCDWPEVVRMAIFDGCWTRASCTGERGGFRGGESTSRGGITIALQAADMPGWSQTGGPREAAERSR
jgi:hypothetical protein